MLHSRGPTPTNSVFSFSDSSGLYTPIVHTSPSGPLYQCSAHPLLKISCPPSAHLVSSPFTPSSFSPDSLRILQWNTGVLRVSSTKLLHFIRFHPVNLICIQESNLNLSVSFRIPGFFALLSDRTHSRSGILSPDDPQVSGDVVIVFVRQGLSFSELSTSSLSLLLILL